MDEYLYRKYPDDPFADWKGKRLLAAYLWVRRHIDELNLPGVAVVGASNFAIEAALARALYRVWMVVPEERLHQDADVAWIVGLAREEKDV